MPGQRAASMLVLLAAVLLPFLAECQIIGTAVGSSAPTGTKANLTAITTGSQKVSAARLKELADQWRLTPEEANAIGEPHGAGKMRICVDPFTPGVYCEPGETNQDKFDGYLVVLFETISRDVPWLSDSSSWYFSCMPTHDVYNALVGKGINGSCMMSTAAVPLLPSLLERGIQPSWAVEKSGLLIMTTTDPSMKTGLWAPFAAFTWPVWLCLILTTLFVPLVLWVFEMVAAYLRLPTKKEQQLARKLMAARSSKNMDSAKGVDDVEAATDVIAAGMVSMNGGQHGAGGDAVADGPKAPKMFSDDWYMLHFRTPKKDVVAVLHDYLTRSGLKFVRMTDPPGVQTMAAYAVLFGYGLLLTIIGCLYAASAAAMLTTMSLTPSITSVNDLKGRSVGTWEEYATPLSTELGLATVPYPWNDKRDEEAMLDALSTGMVSALIMDEGWVRYITSRRCNFLAVGQPFQISDYVYGYNRRMQAALTEDMDRYLQAAVQLHLPEKMARLYIDEGPGCASASVIDPTQGVRLNQVWGLWVVLAITIGIAGLCNAYQWLLRRKLKQAAKSAAARAASMRSMRSERRASRQASKLAGGVGAAGSGIVGVGAQGSSGSRRAGPGKDADDLQQVDLDSDGLDKDAYQLDKNRGAAKLAGHDVDGVHRS